MTPDQLDQLDQLDRVDWLDHVMCSKKLVFEQHFITFGSLTPSENRLYFLKSMPVLHEITTFSEH